MALILRRRRNESIIINGNVKVTVVAIERNKVKLCIKAPQEIEVIREELLRRQGSGDRDEEETTQQTAYRSL